MGHAEMDTTRDQLEHDLRDARARTLELVSDLDDAQLMGPRLAITNPLLWEIGHLAWFQARWVLGRLRNLPHARADADRLYDSFAVAHDTRWDLPLPTRRQTLDYMQAELDRACEALYKYGLDPETVYFYRLVTYHEDMHDEAFTYTRQTLGYPTPSFLRGVPARPSSERTRATPRDVPFEFVEIPGGDFELGAARNATFVFDNEKWAHPVRLEPFRMATRAVTNAQFAAFVEDAGYERRDLWDAEGWTWREKQRALHPVYWRRSENDWEQRVFNSWRPLERAWPVLHVSWHEAAAFCRWSGTRLPTEAEWEAAAACERAPAAGSGSSGTLVKCRRHPWGDASPTAERANLDGVRGLVDAADLAPGDSAFGCRQMYGNVWEWTATEFHPFPGFVVDPYKEYSEPWFDGRHMVLRGGCWVTRARLLRNTWRNFYTRDRRDVFAGFRVCAR